MNIKKIISSSIICILILVPIVVIADTQLFKEPERSVDVPDHAKWDTEKGCYINTKAVEMEEKIKDQPDEDTGAPKQDEMEKWIEDNKKSNDIIDQAIIKWYEESKLTKNTMKSYYYPNEDPAFVILINLPKSETENMVKKIENNHPYRSILMRAVEEKTKTKFSDLIDPSKEKTQKWVKNYKEWKIKNEK